MDGLEETPGVDDETPENGTAPDKVVVQEKITERTSGGMNLHRQLRKDYNHNNYIVDVFNTTDGTHGKGIIVLQLNSDSFEITEDTFDEAAAECMFLTKTLRWNKGPNKENNPTSDAGPNDVTKLAKYLCLTK